MMGLKGKEAEDFVIWFNDIRLFMPPKMSIFEARVIYERKLREEEALKYEAKDRLKTPDSD